MLADHGKFATWDFSVPAALDFWPQSRSRQRFFLDVCLATIVTLAQVRGGDSTPGLSSSALLLSSQQTGEESTDGFASMSCDHCSGSDARGDDEAALG